MCFFVVVSLKTFYLLSLPVVSPGPEEIFYIAQLYENGKSHPCNAKVLGGLSVILIKVIFKVPRLD